MPNKSAKEILIEARALIADPEHHCKGHYAEDASGNITSLFTASAQSKPKAVRYCALGAMEVAGNGSPRRILGKADELLIEASLKLFDKYPVDVNDNMAHADVLAIYDEAIRLAK